MDIGLFDRTVSEIVFDTSTKPLHFVLSFSSVAINPILSIEINLVVTLTQINQFSGSLLADNLGCVGAAGISDLVGDV